METVCAQICMCKEPTRQTFFQITIVGPRQIRTSTTLSQQTFLQTTWRVMFPCVTTIHPGHLDPPLVLVLSGTSLSKQALRRRIQMFKYSGHSYRIQGQMWWGCPGVGVAEYLGTQNLSSASWANCSFPLPCAIRGGSLPDLGTERISRIRIMYHFQLYRCPNSYLSASVSGRNIGLTSLCSLNAVDRVGDKSVMHRENWGTIDDSL